MRFLVLIGGQVKEPKVGKTRKTPIGIAAGLCLCGAVKIEIDTPAFWAWHDHSRTSRIAHGTAYATYVGCWKSRVRVIKGEDALTCYQDKATKTARTFCARCGTPIFYTRHHSPRMVNLPRALFETRTGREPRYHIRIEDAPE
jgi:hypothetical protein